MIDTTADLLIKQKGDCLHIACRDCHISDPIDGLCLAIRRALAGVSCLNSDDISYELAIEYKANPEGFLFQRLL